MLTLHSLARIIVLPALVAGLAACSAIKLGYNNLDEIAYWWLDSYVDFTDDQAPRAREDLARLHWWHRNEELPRLMRMLQDMEQLAPRDITPAQACTFVTEFRRHLRTVADRAEPAAVTLATALGPEQLLHLQHKYQKNNAKYDDEWLALPPVEQREKRFKQFQERAEMIYGRLDEPQREALRRDIDPTIFDPRRILAERKRRQQDSLQMLRQVAGGQVGLGDARKLVRGYLDRVQVPPVKEYRDYQETLIQEGCRHFAVLHNSTSPAQREAAVLRLRAYQRDLRELAAPQ
jgi:hypothetical protein